MREILLALYEAAVRGADPFGATRRALGAHALDTGAGHWIVALGKAAPAMARGALEVLAERGLEPRGGLIVASAPAESPHPALPLLVGDHPVPGEHSYRAAAQLDAVAGAIPPNDIALVLLSGGTSSLVAAPVDGVREEELAQLYDALLGSGAPIGIMNAIRRRFSRWGAGRLAVAIHAPVRCIAISDVLGDDPATIGSGACTADPLTASELVALIAREGLEGVVPPPLRHYLADVVAGRTPETPKPDDAAFQRVRFEIALRNRDALEAVAAAAHARGIAPVKIVDAPLDDDATLAGARLVDELIRFREAGLLQSPASREAPAASGALACMLWGGETTVRLGATPPPGGRCQELALAAAHALHAAGARGHGIALLAAGTDGRDGPTDAAGAIVDATTWKAIAHAGRDPASDLVAHESHRALDAASALVRVGQTGTNVQDVVVGVVG